MSRIGRAPIPIPQGVTVTIDGQRVTVSGPKGSISREVHPDLGVAVSDGVLSVSRPTDERQHRALHGLTRSLLNNMVVGVTTGHRRGLVISGIGFRCEQVGPMVNLQVGYSHPVLVAPDEGVELKVEGNNRISVTGIDKERVGDMAARIRAVRRVKPYIFRGDFQGIRYDDEQPRRKAGKQGV
ncbi:MAG: 50S ribosomal protein L6 [Armatimonadetes bacterium]|nr:50S ribosomal protein L6 [Armatimonadota bacterium]